MFIEGTIDKTMQVRKTRVVSGLGSCDPRLIYRRCSPVARYMLEIELFVQPTHLQQPNVTEGETVTEPAAPVLALSPAA